MPLKTLSWFLQNELSFLSQHLVINERLLNAKLEEYSFLLEQRQIVNEKSPDSFTLIEKSIGKVYLYFDIENYIFLIMLIIKNFSK